MNSEVISSRYAKALLAYVEETGSGNKVYSQVLSVTQAMQQVPELMGVIHKRDDVALVKKAELLSIALGEPLSDELLRFLELVSSHGRMDMFHLMLMSYIVRYRQTNNIKVGTLVTASPDEGLRERLETMFSDRTACDVHFTTGVDPELIGHGD